MKRHFKYLTPENKQNIIKEYTQGSISLARLARKYQIWVPNLRKLLIENHVQIKSYKHSHISEKIIKFLWINSNLTIVELEDALNITRKVIKRICKNIQRNNNVLDNTILQQKIKQFKSKNTQVYRMTRNAKIIKQNVIDDYINSNLFIFQIRNKYHISDRRLRKWTKNLIRINPPNTENISYLHALWRAKYGEKEGDIKIQQLREKQSILYSGKNNPMYGKPSPQGSGNGWKGWYLGFYFRSLRELSYLIYLNENGIKYATGESKRLSIKYIFNNQERTYRPDFIINNNELIEIKPKKLHTTPNVLAKKEAAEIFCRQRNWKYTLTDYAIDIHKIYELYNAKQIVFAKNYETKFLQYHTKSK